jgi:CheY-like chemotaxis protein
VPQTLLLADDSVTIQRVIELTFADEDIDVVAVSDGDQAIARLESVPPDIVLVDAGMPGKTGYDVAAYVKRSPRLSHIPVVLLTGAFEPVDPARAAGAGCDGVLAKPFEPQQVIGRVKELLGRPMRPIGSLEGVFGGQSSADSAAESGAKSIDDYFDQLDAAFSNLAGKPAPAAERAVPAQVDWFGLRSATSDRDQETDTPFPVPASPWPAPPPPVREAPVTPPATETAAPLITDDLVERVSKRVLEQLSDNVVRETVATIAERLIREEIERIKSSMD